MVKRYIVYINGRRYFRMANNKKEVAGSAFYSGYCKEVDHGGMLNNYGAGAYTDITDRYIYVKSRSDETLVKQGYAIETILEDDYGKL